MHLFNRIMDLSEIPPHQSLFLLGARNTGKSTFLRQKCPESLYYDLLKGEEYMELVARPWLLREKILAESKTKLQLPIIIDEIQKIPGLLDEVHWLIENKRLSFILCGSSARKLRHGSANLLGGRAWDLKFFPLVYKEIPNFDLLRALNHGLLPINYLSNNPQRNLNAYVNLYLKEEIQEEGIVRNLQGFARFLEVSALCNTEMLNYANIARDTGIDAKTVKSHFQILNDTLIGYLVDPFILKQKRDLITATPKFYMFDTGVANYLGNKKIESLRGYEAGKAFEQYIFMELMAYIGMKGLNERIEYWRSKSGLEVDFVLRRGDVAIEVKLSDLPTKEHLHGLIAFCEDYSPKHAIVVCKARQKRKLEIKPNLIIDILPWQDFLDKLWLGEYV